jgi:DNA-3-methyladenine glycosylase II
MGAKRIPKPGVRATRRAKRRPAKKRIYHPGPPIADEAGLLEAAERLRAKDPELIERLIAIGGPPPLRRREAGFAGMAAIIVAQQVSTASATAIFGRLQARIVPLEAAEIAKATEEDLRACGLSNAKIRALLAVAQAVAEDGLDLAGLGDLDAEDAHNALVAVKGVGPWTADVFLLFCLGHPDAERLERIAERWRPLRGVAARMLWAYYRGVKARAGMALADASR